MRSGKDRNKRVGKVNRSGQHRRCLWLRRGIGKGEEGGVLVGKKSQVKRLEQTC